MMRVDLNPGGASPFGPALDRPPAPSPPCAIDFAAIGAAALKHSDVLLGRWLPDGDRLGDEWIAKNPKRIDQTAGSFSINVITGRWADFATSDKGGDLIDLAAFLFDLSQADAARHVAGEIGMAPAENTPPASRGVTLLDFAERKRIPIDLLTYMGVTETRPSEKYPNPALCFPYKGPDGQRCGTHLRCEWEGKGRFRWAKGSKLCLYGAQDYRYLPQAGFAVIVGGESDTLTLLHHHIPALGLPGEGLWDEARDAWLFDNVPIILAVIEPDEGGAAMLTALAKSAILPRLWLIKMRPEAKDVSALYLADPADFEAGFKQLMDNAEQLTADEMLAVAATLKKAAPEAQQQLALPAAQPVGLIEEFNARYAVVNEAGKPFVYERKHDPSLERYMLVKSTFGAFRDLYLNRLVTIGGELKQAADYWLRNPKRRQYLGGITLDPTNTCGPEYWNLWQGFSVEPAPGDWSRLRNHIRDVICSGNEAHFNYVLNWLARMFQHPEKRGEVAIVLRGKRGTGKGKFADWTLRAFGQHGLQISHPQHLVGKHNAHLRDCILLFADEAFFAGDKTNQGVLQALITERTITIEPKNVDLMPVRNLLHVIMASNEDWVVPAGDHERRYCVLDVSEVHLQDIPYFKAIDEQMESGGLAAMIHELQHRDISTFEVRDFPRTEALADQRVRSLGSLDKWWLTVLSRGYVFESRFGTPLFATWNDSYTTELLWQSYLQWCAGTRERWPQGREALGKRMADLGHQRARPRCRAPIGEVEVLASDPRLRNGAWLDQEAVKWADHQPQYQVVSLSEARSSFTDKTSISGDWDEREPGEEG
jgi:hypothetical protein